MHARSINGILEGRKTQTRRIISLRVTGPNKPKNIFDFYRGEKWVGAVSSNDPYTFSVKSPYGTRGDRLWVREAFYIDDLNWIGQRLPKESPVSLSGNDIYYRADGECCDQIAECQCKTQGKVKWRQSIHMPRWASRLSLEVTSIRVERVQDISEADAKAEGIRKEDLPYDPDNFHPPGSYGFVGNNNPLGKIWPRPQQAFAELWDDTNGKGAWDRNDWVWVVDFKRIEQ